MSISVKKDMRSYGLPDGFFVFRSESKVRHVFGSSFWYYCFGGRRIGARKVLLNGLRESPTDDGAHPFGAPVQ